MASRGETLANLPISNSYSNLMPTKILKWYGGSFVFTHDVKITRDGVFDILKRLFFGFALGHATGKSGAVDHKTGILKVVFQKDRKIRDFCLSFLGHREIISFTDSFWLAGRKVWRRGLFALQVRGEFPAPPILRFLKPVFYPPDGQC